jgi:Ion channel
VHWLVGLLGAALWLIVLWDAFETVVLPRHVTRSFRLARFFFRSMWRLWTTCARGIRSVSVRETYLSFFGPLSMLLLLAFWAATLALAFAMLLWAGGFAANGAGKTASFRTDLYFSGTTFSTLGLGDVTPATTFGRVLAVCEAATGFGFLAIMIAYLPTLYGGFSQREVNISLLDARAGSPPTAAELLRRHGRQRVLDDGLAAYLREWEISSAQLMETHLTYPFLCFFRSQHNNQSWVAAFTAILDVCALLIAYGEGETKWQAQLTFAISRHAVADLAEILRVRSRSSRPDRLPPEDLPKVRSFLVECGVPQGTATGDLKLQELRAMYEPSLEALSRLLWMPLPSWGIEGTGRRKPTMWDRIVAPGGAPPSGETESGHHF